MNEHQHQQHLHLQGDHQHHGAGAGAGAGHGGGGEEQPAYANQGEARPSSPPATQGAGGQGARGQGAGGQGAGGPARPLAVAQPGVHQASDSDLSFLACHGICNNISLKESLNRTGLFMENLGSGSNWIWIRLNRI